MGWPLLFGWAGLAAVVLVPMARSTETAHVIEGVRTARAPRFDMRHVSLALVPVRNTVCDPMAALLASPVVALHADLPESA